MPARDYGAAAGAGPASVQLIASAFRLGQQLHLGVARVGLKMPELDLRGILWPMPRSRNERDAWEHELREELPAQLAAYQQELAAGQADKTRREFLEWHVRRVQKRMADLEARLAKTADGRER